MPMASPGSKATVIARATLSDGKTYDVIYMYPKGAALPVAPAGRRVRRLQRTSASVLVLTSRGTCCGTRMPMPCSGRRSSPCWPIHGPQFSPSRPTKRSTCRETGSWPGRLDRVRLRMTCTLGPASMTSRRPAGPIPRVCCSSRPRTPIPLIRPGSSSSARPTTGGLTRSCPTPRSSRGPSGSSRPSPMPIRSSQPSRPRPRATQGADMGPEKTIDGYGLDAEDLHSDRRLRHVAQWRRRSAADLDPVRVRQGLQAPPDVGVELQCRP